MRKETGLLFKPAMAAAADQGIKTMTRRVITPQPEQTPDQKEPEFWFQQAIKNLRARKQCWIMTAIFF
jgi:hypothetical protein